MRLSSFYGLFGLKVALITLTSTVSLTQGVDLNPVPPSNLDLSQLGQVALVGDFDSISLYTYRSQSEGGSNTNGSEAIITPLPDGVGFGTVASADGHINAMCPFVLRNGTLAGVVVAGNFTSLGGIEASVAALITPDADSVVPLQGLSGQVNAVLCDQETNSVYFGGDFKGPNSTNAIAWVGMTGWTSLPFAGFNGPVSSITKAPSGDNIVFGGSFDGLGNATTPTRKDGQVINLSTAELTTGGSTDTEGFGDPRNIVCKEDGVDGPGNTWLLADERPGFWRAEMGFGYIPTKLRLWNTHQDGRGTKTFRFTALPIDGIMNFTYTDASGNTRTCDARCPLSDDPAEEFRDFRFVNPVGMSSFRIDISDWYGQGGGLNGIKLFEDDIFAYAVDDFNEPSCGNITSPSSATATGPWVVTPSGSSQADYLTATIGNGSTAESDVPSIVFQPDIDQSGNYSVLLFTPGCVQDGTCDSRGIVTVNATLTSRTSPDAPVSTELYQTNMFDKFDSIYLGPVDASSDSFRPSVTVTPQIVPGESITVVAARVKFQLISSTGGLNGLFEFNPDEAVVNTDFSESAIDRAGTDLNKGAVVTSLDVNDGTMFVGGNFSGDNFENIMLFSDGEVSSLPGGGLNAGVLAMLIEGGLLYVGGNFTDTNEGGIRGLNRIAAYSISNRTWQALGAGVNGQITMVAPLPLNLTDDGEPETTIAFGGNFTEILAFGDNSSVPANGLAIWVPSQRNWLQNINIPHLALQGKVMTSVNTPDNITLIAGTLSSLGMAFSGAVSMSSDDDDLSLGSLPVHILAQLPESSSKRKRALNVQDINGVTTGYFFQDDNHNVTCLGGHFSARATDGSIINNIVFLNGSNQDTVTGTGEGIDQDSVILALDTQDGTLFAGGALTGQIGGSDVNGLVSYDLIRAQFTSTQPPALDGPNVVVNAVAPRPSNTEVYVGGSFDSAGSLDCTAVCMFETTTSQWNRLGTGIDGTVNGLAWGSKDRLIAVGNLTVGSNDTTMATFNAENQEWTAVEGAASVPGPITALCQGSRDATHFWVAGQASDGSSFLIKFDGSAFVPVGGDIFGSQTTIRGIQMLSLTESHDETDLLDEDHVLLVTGQLELPNFGNASAALFNGTDLTPFILSNTADGQPGSLARLFASEEKFFPSESHGHSLVFVVFISMLCALGCLFIIVIIGIIIDRIQRHKNGYIPAPTYTDKHSNVGRIRPEELFQSLGRGGRGAAPGDPPMI